MMIYACCEDDVRAREVGLGGGMSRYTGCKITRCVLSVLFGWKLNSCAFAGVAGESCGGYCHPPTSSLVNTSPAANSKECRTTDWPRHKDACNIVEEVKWVWT